MTNINTTIGIKPTTKDRMKKNMGYEDTFDTFINKLLNSFEGKKEEGDNGTNGKEQCVGTAS